MKYWVSLAVVWCGITLGGISYGIEGLSGSTWGTVAHDPAEDETFTIGNITQGIDWLEYRGMRLTTFAQFRYRFLTPAGNTFDAYGPSLGIAVEKWGLELGTEYFWQYKRNTQAIEEGPRFYLEWYFGWDLNRLLR